MAAALARSVSDTLLVDADAYGGAVAQHLGVLDEASGLLGAVRLANGGHLDTFRLAALAREVAPRLRVLTGLPRADRWPEVRESAFGILLDVAVALCPHVVLDLGFAVEQDESAYGAGAPRRNEMTLTALDRADELVVVGSADPVGLARLARGLVELADVAPPTSVRVVVNRARASLGWREKDIRAMVEGFVTPQAIHFLPLDVSAADRAMMTGRPVDDATPLGRALTGLADDLAGTSREGRAGGALSRRRAGTGR